MSVFAELEACRIRNEAAVMITIESVAGSSPRGEGVRMIVSESAIVGTIGGGALEHAALAHAQRLLDENSGSPCVQRREWTLGKALSQCCGGRVSLIFDRIPACDFHIEVFGAGHVAQEIATLLRRIPCVATFHDSRKEWLERLSAGNVASRVYRPDIDLGLAGDMDEHSIRKMESWETGPENRIPIPGNLLRRNTSPNTGMLRLDLHGDNVFAAVEATRAGSYYLVMTHSHERDVEVVEAVLSREDAAFCGLIASRSKAQAFKKRLSRKGFSDAELSRLTAPLGARVRTGNSPMEVAIAALADVLDARVAATPPVSDDAATPALHANSVLA